MKNRTSHTFAKLFDFMHASSSPAQQLRMTALDLETKDLIRSADVVGATTDIFQQPNVNIFSVGMEGIEFGPQGATGPFSKHFYVKYDRSRFQPFSSEAFNAIFPGGRSQYKRVMQQFLSTGAVLSEGETGDLMNRILGGKQKTLIIGHNITFDMNVIGGVQGFRGLSPNAALLDTLQLTQTIFGRDMGFAAGRPQSFTLENLRGVMEAAAGVQFNPATGAAAARIDPRYLGIAYKKIVPAVQYYTPEVINRIPEFAEAYKALDLASLGASHQASVDVRVSMALVHAALLRAERDPYAAKRFKEYLQRIGALPSSFVVDDLALLNKYDVARVQDVMNIGSYTEQRALLKRLEIYGADVIDQIQGPPVHLFYGKKGAEQLTSFVTEEFGQAIGRRFGRVAHKLADRVKDATFVLQDAGLGYTSLAFGRFGDTQSFKFLPLQADALTQRGVLHIGPKTYRAAALSFERAGRLRTATFGHAFYSVLDRLLDKYTLSDENIVFSLDNLLRKTYRAPFFVSGGKVGTAAVDVGGRTVVRPAVLKNLIGSVPMVGGIPSLSATALHGSVSYIANTLGDMRLSRTDGPLLSAKLEISEALQRRNIAIGSGDSAALARAQKDLREASDRLAKALNRDPELAAGYLLSKPEFITEGQTLRLITSSSHLGLIPEERGYKKLRFAGRTSGADRSAAALRLLYNLGEGIGPAYITEFARREMQGPGFLQQRLFANTVEAAVAFYEFSDPYAATEVFGDSGIIATRRGSFLLREYQPIGTVRIPKASSTAVEALKTLFPGLSELDKLQGFHDLLGGREILVEGTLSKEQHRALSLLRQQTPISGGRYLWNILRPRAGRRQPTARLKALSVGDEIVLQFVTPSPAVPATQNILLGPYGETRAMSTLNLDRSLYMGRGLGQVHFLAPTSILTDSKAAAELLLRHRISLAGRTGLIDEMVSFFNKQGTKVFEVAQFSYPGMGPDSPVASLVIPTGVDPRTVFQFMDKWQRHIRDKLTHLSSALQQTGQVAHKIKAYKAFLHGYYGIPLEQQEAQNLLEVAPPGAVKSATVFYTDMSLRTTSSIDVASSLLKGVAVSALKLRTMAFEPGNPLVKVASQLLEEQTGFALKGSRILPPPYLRRFAETLTGRIDKNAPILKPIGLGQFELQNTVAGLQAGTIFHAPQTTIREAAGVPIEDLKGTLFDPRLLRSGAVVELPEAIEIGTSRKAIRTKYAPLPHQKLLDLVGDRIKYRSDSRAGVLARALAALSREGKLDTPVAVPGEKKLTSVSDHLAFAYQQILKGGGLGGYIREGAKVRLPGFSARISQLPKRMLPPGSNPFVSYLTEAGFEEFLSKKYGARSKKAEALRARMKQQGYLYTFLSANPAQTSTHAILTRTEILRDVHRGNARRGAVELIMDPYTYSLVDRDLDQDTIDVILAEEFSESSVRKAGYPTKGAYQDALTEFYMEQQEKLRKDYEERWLKGAAKGGQEEASTFVREIERAILEGRPPPELTGELIESSLGPKIAASVPFTVMRAAKSLLLDTIHATSKEELFQALTEAGADVSGLTDEVLSALRAVDDESAAAAQELLRTYHQSGIAKSGKALPAMNELTSSIVALLGQSGQAQKMSLESMVNETTRIFTEFFKSAEDLGLDVKYGKAAAILDKSDAVSAGKLMGKVFGTTFFALNRAFPGKYNTFVTYLEKLGSTPEKAVQAILGSSDAASAFVDVEAHEALDDLRADLSDVQPPPPAKSVIDDATDRAKRILDKHSRAIKIGAIALGAYAGINLLLGSDEEEELTPPPLQPYGGSPLPPSPDLSRPTDTGPSNIPVLPRRLARISPEHPAPLPAHTARHSFGDINPGYFSTSVTNTIKDERNPLSKVLIANRMRQIESSDFVRD